MLGMLDSFDTDDTFDPFSLVMSLEVNIQLLNTWKLYTTFTAFVLGFKHDNFRFTDK